MNSTTLSPPVDSWDAEDVPETRRGIQFARVFYIGSRLRTLRYGMSIRDLTEHVRNVTGYNWHERTTYRDIQLLIYIGMVEQVGNRYLWIGKGDFFESAESLQFGAGADFASRLQSPEHFRKEGVA